MPKQALDVGFHEAHVCARASTHRGARRPGAGGVCETRARAGRRAPASVTRVTTTFSASARPKSSKNVSSTDSPVSAPTKRRRRSRSRASAKSAPDAAATKPDGGADDGAVFALADALTANDTLETLTLNGRSLGNRFDSVLI